MTLPRPVRVIVGIAIAALLGAVMVMVVIERCERAIDTNKITVEEVLEARR